MVRVAKCFASDPQDKLKLGNAEWGRDSKLILFKRFDGDGQHSWSVPLTGGAPKLLVQLGQELRSHRAEFATDGTRFFFTVTERASELWTAKPHDAIVKRQTRPEQMLGARCVRFGLATPLRPRIVVGVERDLRRAGTVGVHDPDVGEAVHVVRVGDLLSVRRERRPGVGNTWAEGQPRRDQCRNVEDVNPGLVAAGITE